MSANGKPKRRAEGLVVRELAEEVLVYDLERHRAHCLNSTAAAVWRHCDGEASPAEIALSLVREVCTRVDEDVVWLALHDLGRLNLLESPVARPGLSRAQLVRRAGVATATLALPAALSLNVPSASATVCQDPCLMDVDCVGTCTVCNVANLCEPGG